MYKLAIIFFITLVTLLSCEKEKFVTKIEVPAATLQGEWYGLYGTSTAGVNGAPTEDFYLNIRNNGTVFLAATPGSDIVADTSYAITGDSLFCTYTYRSKSNGSQVGTYSLAGRVREGYTFMSGTWGNGANAYNGGAFILGRKQQ